MTWRNRNEFGSGAIWLVIIVIVLSFCAALIKLARIADHEECKRCCAGKAKPVLEIVT